MNHHGSMNRIYRLVWNQVRRLWIPVAETARGRGKSGGRSACRAQAAATAAAAAALSLAMVPLAEAGPTGGQIVSGKGSIITSGTTTDVRQSSQTLGIDWLSFNVAPQETVDFIQPNASAIAVNRIAGSNGSQILGHLEANGQVYLINPNGVVFGAGSQVNVGGLVASTLDVSDASLGSAARSFSGSGAGSVMNEGTLNVAPGGSVALIGNHVSNQGLISAQLGTVALAAGSAVTLTFNGNSLVHLTVDRSVLNSLAENHGLLQADGGHVLMTAGAQDALLASVVNNTGVIEARTVQDHAGTITLLGGMAAGTVNVGGTLDASAPTGGNGGFIETSGAHVEVGNAARITTTAERGLTGSWLIDPQDFTVAASGGDITGATLSTELSTTSVTLQSSSGGKSGSGNVNVNDAVSWGVNTALTLIASNNINVNGSITASSANGRLVLNANTANGSETASGAGTLNLGSGATINLPNVSPTSTTALIINGTPYTVINQLGLAGSTTGTDLQGINGNLSGHYALGSNLDATATGSWNSGAGFNPIGGPTAQFTGIFDGLGHTISGLNINRSSNEVGVFGVTAPAAGIYHVGLDVGVTGGTYVGGLVGANFGSIGDSHVTLGQISGTSDVGGLVGINYGSISTSSATGYAKGFNNVGGLVGVNNSVISFSDSNGSVSGTSARSQDVGGLVGENARPAGGGTYGTIIDSYATGSVSNGSAIGGLVGINLGVVQASFATGTVSGSYGTGGLVGINDPAGVVSDSYASGLVSGSTYVGGLVGENVSSGSTYGTIVNSYATSQASGSTYVGGLVGLNEGKLQTSYSKGRVVGSSHVGGLVGSLSSGGATGTVTSSYWNTTTSGQPTSAGGTGLTTAQMQLHGNFAGFNFTTNPGAAGDNWVMVDVDGTLNNSQDQLGGVFPMLASEYSTTITNAHQLQLMAMNSAASYSLSQNIDAGGTAVAGDVWMSAGFVPVYLSTGIFDGLGHTISGLTSNRPTSTHVGLFSIVGPTGVVRNVGLIGGIATSSGAGGALVGANYGTVSNSYSTGSVTSTVSGDYSDFGGLVGSNFGSIVNSYSSASVSGATQYMGGLVGYNDGSLLNSYATGTVNGSAAIGGLVGQNDGTIGNSYATGAVTGHSYVAGLSGINSSGTISNSYATGSVSGSSYVGGLVATNFGTIATSYSTGSVGAGAGAVVGGLVANNGGTVSNSFWDKTTSGQSLSAGGIGMTTANMQTQANFTSATAANGNVNPNWDFANTWVMYNGHTYPLLRSFMTPLTITATGDTVTYSGKAFSGGNGVTYSVSPNANLLGTVSYGGSAQGAVNVGNYSITPGGLYSNQGGYIINFVSGTLSINQLASVAWVGGTTGNWSTASNWAGGAIPDLSNVAAVTIPKGTTVTYDAGVVGTTLLSSLTDAGKLVMAAGDLSTAGNVTVAGYTQSGGTLDVGGTLTIDAATGAVKLGNIDAAALSITTLKGTITQLAGSAVDVTGASSLTAEKGTAGLDTITLAQAGDSFGGTVTAEGSTITLKDKTALTAVLDSSGATSLTAAGALNVSGTVGTTLTTKTTGAKHTTTFGATTVGTSLNVTSTGAVTETAANILTVDGEGTTTVANPNVTVNGVVGKEIPAP